MSYRVVYGPEIPNIHTAKGRIARFFGGLCLAAGAVVVLCHIWTGDWQVTRTALKELADTCRAGEPLQQAVTAFCRQILENAG